MELEVQQVLMCLGCVYGLKLTLGLLLELRNGLLGYLLPQLRHYLLGPADLKTRYGPWAVVTGSSQGIGRAYALELASRGLNVALVARSKERLEAVAAEVRSHGVEARVIVVDFTDTAAAETAVSELARAGVADIGVLVNNVGMMGPHFLPFLELEAAAARDMVTVNCTSATVLTHSLLPAMLARGRGAIVNIVSSTSFYVMPYFAEYAATKHYMAAFTAGLRAELGRGSGVVIQEVDPGQVDTNMARNLIPISRIEAPPPAWLVAGSLRSLGWTDRTAGWWFHSLHRLVSSLLPGPVLAAALHLFGWWQYRYSSSKRKSQ